MKGAYVLNKLLEYSKLNGKSFSEKIGLIRPQAIYDIQNGKTQNISVSMANKIISAFPEVNKSWLFTGDGEMLIRPEDKITEKRGIVYIFRGRYFLLTQTFLHAFNHLTHSI